MRLRSRGGGASPLLLWLVLLVSLCGGMAFAQKDANPTSLDLINRALSRDEIDLDTAILQKWDILHHPDQLQPRFRSVSTHKLVCATDIFHSIYNAWPLLRPTTQAQLAGYSRRPTDGAGSVQYPSGVPVRHYDTRYFRIHWVATGTDAPPPDDLNHNGIPDWIDAVADAAETARHLEIDEYGYDAPPTDYPGPPGTDDGGDGRYDIYLAEIANSQGALGYEISETKGTSAVRNDASSYIVLDNDFANSGFTTVTPVDLMKATVAHEFFHAVQDAYDTKDQTFPSGATNFWYYEASSVWMEDEVYPNFRGYLERLPGWFKYPETSLDASGAGTNPDDHEYGDAIWNKMLAETYGHDIIRQIWEALARQPDGTDLTSIGAFDVVLSRHGSGRNDALSQFWDWNYITGPNDDGRHYQDGKYYPAIYIDPSTMHSTYPAVSPTPIKYPPGHMASNYIQFSNPGNAPAIKVTFAGNSQAIWSAHLIAVTQGDHPTYAVLPITLDGTGAGSRTVNWTGLDRVILVAGVLSLSGGSYTYTYHADSVSAVAPKVAGASASATTLALAFDSPMDPADVVNPTNYTITSSAVSASPVLNRASTPVNLSNAVFTYNAAQREVDISGLNLTLGQRITIVVRNVRDADHTGTIADDNTSNVATALVPGGKVSAFVLNVNGGHDAQGRSLLDLIAVPYNLTDDNPGDYFGSSVGFAAFDNFTSEATRPYIIYDPTRKNVHLQRGHGFWIRADQDYGYTFPGAVAQDQQPFTIALPDQAWALIGNPFESDIDWNLDAIRVLQNGVDHGSLHDMLAAANPLVAPYAWTWDTVNSQYHLLFDSRLIPDVEDRLRAGEGMFIYSYGPGVSLQFPAAQTTAAASPTRLQTTAGNWAVQVIAASDGKVARGQYFGVMAETSQGLTILNPPPPVASSRQLQVNFLTITRGVPQRSMVDLLGGSPTRATWDFEVDGMAPGQEVTLSWPDLSRLPNNLRLRLVDLATGERRALRTVSNYVFRADTMATPHRFRIELYPASEGRLQISQLQVLPSAGRGVGGFTATFQLTRAADVQVNVMTPTGRIVSTTTAHALPAGLNTMTWTSRAAGPAPPQGIYLIELVAQDDEGQVVKAVRSVRTH